MRISARNVFEGEIENVEVGAVMANIKIKIESPELITTIITKESVEKLDLKKGDTVICHNKIYRNYGWKRVKILNSFSYFF